MNTQPRNTTPPIITGDDVLRIREHRGFGHGLRVGLDHAINCESCKRERFTSHTCHAGPLCGSWPDCDHDSCLEIEHEFCVACEVEACEDDAAGIVICERHGRTRIETTGSSSGFAGGTIYFASLACGCYLHDESDDLRAAR